jgi:hypothetical protein
VSVRRSAATRARHARAAVRFAVLLVAAATAARAQSLIVGIPNAEVTKPGRFFGTHESQLGAVNPRDSWTSFTFMTYGIGAHTELAVSLLNVSSPASGNRTVSTGFKSSLPVGRLLHRGSGPAHGFAGWAERWEFVATGGAMVLQSLDDRGTGGWLYGHASVKLPIQAEPWRRTRLTVGPSWGTRQQFGSTKTSVMVGIEQPITRRVWLVGDWYSGDHDLAVAIPAIQFNLPDDLVVITGWKLPNPGSTAGGQALVLEIAKMF